MCVRVSVCVSVCVNMRFKGRNPINKLGLMLSPAYCPEHALIKLFPCVHVYVCVCLFKSEKILTHSWSTTVLLSLHIWS